MLHKVYRLAIDEDGYEDVRDFTDLSDAYREYEKAEKRSSVFSATITECYSDGYERFVAQSSRTDDARGYQACIANASTGERLELDVYSPDAFTALKYARDYLDSLEARKVAEATERRERQIAENIRARDEAAERAQAPLDQGLADAVVVIAAELFPDGFEVSENAPSTLEALTAHLDSGARMVVYSGASDATIFGPRGVNWAFRAWHDQIHYDTRQPFTPQGEYAVATAQCNELIARYGWSDQVRQWCRLIDAEVNGQLAYASRHDGAFPVNQKVFVLAYLMNPEAACAATF